MSLFDSKLEVLDFEFTPYGKHLLSIGKLKPSYYAFYDNDIVYDGLYANLTESQNSIEPRIQEDTPRLHPLYNFHGAETSLTSSFDPINVKNKALFYNHIGTSQYEGNNCPTWELNVLSGEISSSTTNYISSFNTLVNIPQLNINLDYNVYYLNPDSINLQQTSSFVTSSALSGKINSFMMDYNRPSEYLSKISSDNPNHIDLYGPYEDNNYVVVEGRELVFDIIENNNFNEKDSLEIEVFLYTDDTEENIKQLYFFENYLNSIKNDILLNTEDILANIPNIEITEEYVEYYFSTIIDNYINNEIVCKFIDNGTYKPAKKTKYSHIVKCKEQVAGYTPEHPSIPMQDEKCDV
jgi:hypothetical protein